MRRLMVVIFSAAGMFFTAGSAAQAQFYIGAHAGGNFVEDSDIGGLGVDANASLDPGFAVGGLLGYRFGINDNLSVDLEGEFTYRNNSVDRVSVTGFASTSDGVAESFAGMANAWLNWEIGNSGFAPYIGGGIGGVELDVNNAQLAGSAFDGKHDFVLGGQVGGGLGYQLNDNVVLSLDYRYLTTEDAKYDGVSLEYQNHSVMLGFKYLFK